jgi:ferredoxin
MAEDNLSHLKNSTAEKDGESLEINANQIGCAKEAAEICPVQAIEIVS